MVEQKEFPKITEQELDRLRQFQGIPLPVKDPFNRYATIDTIAHFAQGMGDTNPLFSDEEYGKRTRYGCVVAPPTFLFTCYGRGAPQGLAGIHAMWSGASFEMEIPLKGGTGISGTVTPSGLTPKETKFAGRAILQGFTFDFATPEGNPIGKSTEWLMRTERDAARSKGKYDYLEVASYTPEEIDRIFADYEKEEIRGAEPRYWEDVVEGQELAHVVKGPLRVTDNIGLEDRLGLSAFRLRPQDCHRLLQETSARFHRQRQRHPGCA